MIRSAEATRQFATLAAITLLIALPTHQLAAAEAISGRTIATCRVDGVGDLAKWLVR